jgi:hypothetical protein
VSTGSATSDSAQAGKPEAGRLAAAPAQRLAVGALPSQRADGGSSRGKTTAADPVSGGSGPSGPRALREAPAPGSPQSGSGSGGSAPGSEPAGGGSSGAVAPVNLPEAPDLPDLPAIPNAPAPPPQVGDLVKPVTDAPPDGLRISPPALRLP